MSLSRHASLGAVLAVLAVPAVAVGQDPASPAPAQPTPRIAAGVSAGGVDLSGLTVLEAARKLSATLKPALAQDVVLGVAGVPWKLTAAEHKQRLDATATAKAALAAPAGTTTVPLSLSHAKLAVRDFVAKIANRVHRSTRDARMTITLKRIRLTRSKQGRDLDRTKAQKLVNDALDQGVTERVLHLAITKVRPKTTADDLRRQNRTIVTVDKAHFLLRLFKDFKVVKTYRVAVGQPAYPTPTGLFRIQNKQVNPVWSVPNSPWAGELGGTTVEGGSAANPLKARWMGITNGVGIHGTGEDGSIGSRASHGCIRMHVPDVIALYPRVPVGTPVLLK